MYGANKSHHSHENEHTSNKTTSNGNSARVWGYSTIAVVAISLVGLLGVAIVPIMQKVFFDQLLQFLVAMAVGALTGDAMLHLLPHAIAGDSHDDTAAVWKGLCGLLGIYVFFVIQSVLNIISASRKRRRGKKALTKTIGMKIADCDIDIPSHEQLELQEQQVLTVPELETSHGHSHQSVPTSASVSSVAWMVILGDGIHNFSDGLAIGAAFASSITGGFSTTIAVFCHELPHEIGDFAVLLKAGMSIKQAVIYNIVSSVLCLLGMVIGVALGNIENASAWIFAGVGGMFIYISLVTMIPELTSTVTSKPGRDLFLQCSGICVGAGIMLLIAVYEHELKTALD